MRKDRIVEITGLAILLIQRLYGKDYKNAVVTFYLLFVIAILDREITEENIFELAVWTMAELAVGIAIAIYQEIISVIVMLLIMGFLFYRCLSNCFDFGKQRRTNIVFLIKAELS